MWRRKKKGICAEAHYERGALWILNIDFGTIVYKLAAICQGREPLSMPFVRHKLRKVLHMKKNLCAFMSYGNVHLLCSVQFTLTLWSLLETSLSAPCSALARHLHVKPPTHWPAESLFFKPYHHRLCTLFGWSSIQVIKGLRSSRICIGFFQQHNEALNPTVISLSLFFCTFSNLKH